MRAVYIPGLFLNAELDKASEDNERQCLAIEMQSGARIGCSLIDELLDAAHEADDDDAIVRLSKLARALRRG